MKTFMLILASVIMLNAFIVLYRAFAGPTIQDRLVGINIVNTKTLMVLILFSYVLGKAYYIDIALVYALLNFVVTVAASRYIETERGGSVA